MTESRISRKEGMGPIPVLAIYILCGPLFASMVMLGFGLFVSGPSFPDGVWNSILVVTLMHYLLGFVPAAIVGLTAAAMHLVEEVTEREWIGFPVIVGVSLAVSVCVLGTLPNRAAITHVQFVQMVLSHVLPAILCWTIVKVVAALRDDAEVSP